MAGGAREGSAGDDGKTTAAAKKVPPLVMFRYADRADAALMAVGTVAAVANGMSEPLMTVVFASVIQSFGAGDDATVLPRVSKVTRQIYGWFCNLHAIFQQKNRAHNIRDG